MRTILLALLLSVGAFTLVTATAYGISHIILEQSEALRALDISR